MSSVRGRYLAVFLTAVVGAGVVVLGTGAALPDRGNAGLSMTSGDARAQDADRADRDTRLVAPITLPAPTVWVLPIHSYAVTSYFGLRWGVLHPGVDLGAPTGTP